MKYRKIKKNERDREEQEKKRERGNHNKTFKEKNT